MNTTELSKGTRVEVVQGSFSGTQGVIEDVDYECSVMRIMDNAGEVVFAFKGDALPI